MQELGDERAMVDCILSLQPEPGTLLYNPSGQSAARFLQQWCTPYTAVLLVEHPSSNGHCAPPAANVKGTARMF